MTLVVIRGAKNNDSFCRIWNNFPSAHYAKAAWSTFSGTGLNLSFDCHLQTTHTSNLHYICHTDSFQSLVKARDAEIQIMNTESIAGSDYQLPSSSTQVGRNVKPKSPPRKCSSYAADKTTLMSGAGIVIHIVLKHLHPEDALLFRRISNHLMAMRINNAMRLASSLGWCQSGERDQNSNKVRRWCPLKSLTWIKSVSVEHLYGMRSTQVVVMAPVT